MYGYMLKKCYKIDVAHGNTIRTRPTRASGFQSHRQMENRTQWAGAAAVRSRDVVCELTIWGCSWGYLLYG